MLEITFPENRVTQSTRLNLGLSQNRRHRPNPRSRKGRSAPRAGASGRLGPASDLGHRFSEPTLHSSLPEPSLSLPSRPPSPAKHPAAPAPAARPRSGLRARHPQPSLPFSASAARPPHPLPGLAPPGAGEGGVFRFAGFRTCPAPVVVAKQRTCHPDRTHLLRPLKQLQAGAGPRGER